MPGPNKEPRRERSLINYERRLVVFDTNVVEARYLAPLLRGEAIRDLARLREHASPCIPAIFVKSYYEICHHVKYGTKKFPWCTPDYGYPGGLETGRTILQRMRPPVDPDNIYWWFNQAEEWRGLDWAEHEDQRCALASPQARESVVHEIAVQREFASWKFSLSAFCQRIWTVLEANFSVLTQHDVYGFGGEYLDEVFQLEQDMAQRRLIPSEDFEIVTAALACRASAFVTNEKAMLLDTAFSLDPNWKTAFVHAERLLEALEEDFVFRDYRQSSRGNGDG